MTTKAKSVIFDFHDFEEHYQTIETDGRSVSESLTDILIFLKEGRVWYRNNFGDHIEQDFQERVEFIAKLKSVFEESEVNDDHGLFIKCTAHEINLKPIISLINEHQGITDQLDLVAERMIDCLHDTNTFFFKGHIRKLNSIKFMFYDIEKSIN